MYFVSDETHKFTKYNDYETAWFQHIWASWSLSKKFSMATMRSSWPIYPKLNKPFINGANHEQV